MRTHTIMTAAVTILLGIGAAQGDTEGIATIMSDVTTEFGVYSPVVVDVNPAVDPYEIEDDLSNVSNSGDFTLEEAAINKLAENGFVCTASPMGQIYDIYNQDMERGVPVFVTTDACLHTYHVLYDYILRELETGYLIDDLTDLTEAAISRTTDIYNTATEPTVKQAALNATAFFMVAMSVLTDGDIEGYELYSEVADAVNSEVTSIINLSAGYVPSPLFAGEGYPYREDYSQYKPRGHYTRSPELERYFRAMMWYGRITFSATLEGASQEGYRHAARTGILVASAIAGNTTSGGDDTEEVWDRIYQPTVFFVGKSDDITFRDYRYYTADSFSSDPVESPDVLADDSAVDAFIEKVRDLLPDPQITVIAGKGLRFMGQRYIPDSYMLDQLVFEFVQGRLMPRGLDVMAVLGSERAYEILDTVYHDTDYPGYTDQMTKLRTLFSGYGPETWAQNLYYNWLYSLAPLLDVKGAGYPTFMQTAAWVDKDLNTALGSWAELRHDTILYAKQSETKETGEPPIPPLVKGYVEPNPEVYARLAALAAFMRQGLNARGILGADSSERLESFETLMIGLTGIAVNELENTAPSDSEYLLINNFGATIETITSFPPEPGSNEQNTDDLMAVIADVHTDPNTNTVLEVGVGHPLNIYVVAPVEGTLTLTRGGVFAYHEFVWSLEDERLDDEEWQNLQSGPDAQPMPEWTASFLSGDSSPMMTPMHHYSEGMKVVSVREEQEPSAFGVIGCSPNPFNPSTTITFNLPASGIVKVEVFAINGQAVATLLDEWRGAGQHEVVWDASGFAAGLYVCRVTSQEWSGTVKMMLVK